MEADSLRRHAAIGSSTADDPRITIEPDIAIPLSSADSWPAVTRSWMPWSRKGG